MFETINDTLFQCLFFLVIGFLLGLSYEALRILRLFIRHGTVAVAAEDVVFFAASAFVMFVAALCAGEGYFRLYYVAFATVGAAVYFFTLGRLIKLISKKIAALLGKILAPIGRFLKKVIRAFSHKFTACFVLSNKYLSSAKKTLKNHLPKRRQLLYNKDTIKINKGGEKKSAVKVRIRKKT